MNPNNQPNNGTTPITTSYTPPATTPVVTQAQPPAKPKKVNGHITTFIIPTIGRDTLKRAIASCKKQGNVIVKEDTHRLSESVMRNEGIEAAKTDWISFLDDDDTVTADYTQRLEEEIEANPEAEVIIFREYFPKHGIVIPNKDVICGGNVGISFSAKRSVLLEHPFIDQPHEDLALLLELEAAGKKIVFSDYLTYHMRH